jgi:hypothetical protein
VSSCCAASADSVCRFVPELENALLEHKDPIIRLFAHLPRLVCIINTQINSDRPSSDAEFQAMRLQFRAATAAIHLLLPALARRTDKSAKSVVVVTQSVIGVVRRHTYFADLCCWMPDFYDTFLIAWIHVSEQLFEASFNGMRVRPSRCFLLL